MWKHPLGEVHGGTDATTGARVLVTALNAGAMIHDRLLEAAQQVAREAAALTTTLIAKPIDVQRLADGRVGIATEALEGTPLTNVSRNQPMPATRVYAMLRQLCSAIAEAHGHKVVHRAISMGSVLLRARADKPDAIVLTDFALGPLLDAELVVQKEDAALQPVTPERISGQERDAREDMYLLGCLGYTLLTGGSPFRTGTPDAVRRRHAIEDPMPVTDRLRGARAVPVALAGWVHRCLAKEPDDRFDNAAELEAALCFAQIEDRVQTPWDDLPLPDVDASRQARIREGLQAKGGPRPVAVDDQITVSRTADFGTDDDDDGDKTIVRTVQLPNLGTPQRSPGTPVVTQHHEERSRSIVLEQDAVSQMNDAQQDETHVVASPAANERHEETLVGRAHPDTFIGRDDTSPIDRRDTLIASVEELDNEADTFAGEQASDATWVGPVHPAAERPSAEPTSDGPAASALPSEQDTIRGPAPQPPQDRARLQAVRPPMPTSAPPPAMPTSAPTPPFTPAFTPAVPSAVRDEEDSLGDLATRITHLAAEPEAGTVVVTSPPPPMEPPPSFTGVPPDDLDPPTIERPHNPPAPASAAATPTVGWGLPPPAAELQSFSSSPPAAWGNPPVDAEMTMVGMGDFGRSRRIVVFVLGAAIAAGIAAIVMSSGSTPPPPPPAPAEPAPAVTVKPTTPVRPRDPAFETANTAAEFAVAGERALAQKRLEDAEELFQAAIIREPRHVGALLGLGRMRAELNDWEKAETYYQRAVNAAPKDGTARIAHGDALVRLAKVKDARREYKKAKQLGHPDAAARLAGL